MHPASERSRRKRVVPLFFRLMRKLAQIGLARGRRGAKELVRLGFLKQNGLSQWSRQNYRANELQKNAPHQLKDSKSCEN